MKKLMIAVFVATTGLAAGPALADHHMTVAKVVEKDARGRATKVEIDGQVYNVCTSDNSDGCINPREAGLRWGNNPVKSWPGRPISREN